jgi:bacillithiol biosynthesis deacetylase BshB1
MTDFPTDPIDQPYDALFIGAHPDDVEILAGGTVARLVAMGRRVLVADATRGEMGTRGTLEERAQEAADAAEILGVRRVNLGLSDGHIGDDIPAATRAVVRLIRHARPRTIFTHEPDDHHPDHNAISRAVKDAFFQANVLKYDTGQPRHKTHRLFHYVGSRDRWPVAPSFVVDITEVVETKMAALRAFRSQLHNPDYKGPETYVSSDIAWHFMEGRAVFFGSLIGVRYAEGFRAVSPLRIDDPTQLA